MPAEDKKPGLEERGEMMSPMERKLFSEHLKAQGDMYEAKARAKRIAAELAAKGSLLALHDKEMCW
ncbi:hypothetical protein SFHH103_04075 (plasmid) [Sinorhizobium fredii HH103]|uniref:Uncharacterized protein n=1 Tax=Sinorhizobium fredii (strain HH103) TaxID=1117943 RepID=G9ABY6_SINF1|nr:hypothetical protein [Sinorhizobium fredii]CCE98565.1 hypothetical protein SFHH103_04075 [Sinorhizobium fredii HH103]